MASIVFVLIITLFSTDNRHASAIGIIDGFISIDNCRAAGNAWLAEYARLEEKKDIASATCVRKEVKAP